MPEATVFESFPLWALFLLTFLLVVASLEAGLRLGRWRHKQCREEQEGPAGAMVSAMLGLLAFMLAFTFSMAAARYETRRQLLLDEVNSIGTTYLRASVLEEPQRTKMRGLLREYVAVRSQPISVGEMAEVRAQSEALQGQLWLEATAAGRAAPNSIVVGLFMQSLNELIDLHTKRVHAGLRSHVPAILWFVLYAISFTSMAGMGYHAGLTGTARSLVALGLVFCFSIVIWLIADLDRPQEGWIRGNLQGMQELRASMNEP